MELLNDIKFALMPEAILTIFILLICVLTFILKKQMQNFIFYMSLTGITLSLFSISQCSETEALYGSFVSNNFTV
ncbi:MAG: hypothetical protein KAQ92_08730, partial [Candidatus Aenigmarchaeota archaeon]|nr:hypothetical protein [Candidatus Aenigmarchaeota archaeon]